MSLAACLTLLGGVGLASAAYAGVGTHIVTREGDLIMKGGNVWFEFTGSISKRKNTCAFIDNGECDEPAYKGEARKYCNVGTDCADCDNCNQDFEVEQATFSTTELRDSMAQAELTVAGQTEAFTAALQAALETVRTDIATSSEAEAVKNDALKAELLSAMETLRDEAATAANTTATAIAAAGELTAAVDAKVDPLIAWKAVHDSCEGKGLIKGADGCRQLSSSCDEIESTDETPNMKVTPLFFAKEMIPGTVVKVGCDEKYGAIKDTAVGPVTCLVDGTWSDDSVPTCKPCKDENCANCDGDLAVCQECIKSDDATYTINAKGVCTSSFGDCQDALAAGNTDNGVYDLKGANGKKYKAYCDMQVADGGWQLVASVHEDNIQAKCNGEDRWTNTNGNNGRGNKGLGHWQNAGSLFGAPATATKTDYKGIGYSHTDAKNVMVWHVPNETPIAEYYDKSLYRYHTTNDFLAKDYQGCDNCKTLQKVYETFPPISQKYSCKQHRGPAVPVTFDEGTASNFHQREVAPASRSETTAGFIHMSVYNNERAVNAFCPGVRYDGCNTEHSCIGGGGYFPEGGGRQCSDFSGWDWSGINHENGSGWSASKRTMLFPL